MSDATRTKLLTFLIAMAVLVGSVLGFLYYLSFQKVAVTFDTSTITSLTLYRTASASSTTTVGKPVKTLVSGKIYKVRNGTYLLRPAGSKAELTDVPLTVNNATVTLNIDTNYSAAYLQQLLAPQQPIIVAAIYASNPKLASLYQVNAGYLYHHGEWYGTTLSYIGPDSLSRDTLRVVLHKNGSLWTVVTNPPQITLSAKAYPSIPELVLTAVNAIDIGQPSFQGHAL